MDPLAAAQDHVLTPRQLKELHMQAQAQAAALQQQQQQKEQQQSPLAVDPSQSPNRTSVGPSSPSHRPLSPMEAMLILTRGEDFIKHAPRWSGWFSSLVGTHSAVQRHVWYEKDDETTAAAKDEKKKETLALGALYWCKHGYRKRDDTRCIPLSHITGLYEQAETDSFNKDLTPEERERCFSIVTRDSKDATTGAIVKGRTLDLQAKTVAIRNSWMHSIHAILMEAGYNVMENDTSVKRIVKPATPVKSSINSTPTTTSNTPSPPAPTKQLTPSSSQMHADLHPTPSLNAVTEKMPSESPSQASLPRRIDTPGSELNVHPSTELEQNDDEPVLEKQRTPKEHLPQVDDDMQDELQHQEEEHIVADEMPAGEATATEAEPSPSQSASPQSSTQTNTTTGTISPADTPATTSGFTSVASSPAHVGAVAPAARNEPDVNEIVDDPLTAAAMNAILIQSLSPTSNQQLPLPHDEQREINATLVIPQQTAETETAVQGMLSPSDHPTETPMSSPIAQ